MNLPVIWPVPGRYVLAVSGGADSMVLLDLMAGAAPEHGYDLVVAHFDHGLRPGSSADRRLVQGAAERYGLPVKHHEANLGRASEATARAARHAWLEEVRLAQSAGAVITGHHQDDLLETSLLNLARGSGRRGLAPMQDGSILRPLLNASRDQLRSYAATHQVVWREDPTNADTANARNLLRHVILPKAGAAWRANYLEKLHELGTLNKNIDQALGSLFGAATPGASCYSFPRTVAHNLSLAELEELLLLASRRLVPDIELDRRNLQEIALFAKTAAPHHRRPLRGNIHAIVDSADIRVYYMGISDGQIPDAENLP